MLFDDSYAFYTQENTFLCHSPESGNRPDKEDREPPKRLLPAGSRNHVCTQRQQVMREGHVESEAKLEVCCSYKSQLTNDPGRGKVWSKPDNKTFSLMNLNGFNFRHKTK